MDLQKQLKEDAINKGLCEDWQKKFKKPQNVQSLCQMYIKGIDFCINKDYPTLDFLRTNFKGLTSQYGVFIDEIFNKTNIKYCVLNGECTAQLLYNGYSVSEVYTRHDSKAAICVNNNAFVRIDSFDNSEIFICTIGQKSKVIVNIYGNSKVQTLGDNIEIRYTNKQTYEL